MRTIWQFFLVRLRLNFRQPEIFFYIFIVPLMLSAGLAFAYRSDGEVQVRVVVYGDPALAARLAAQPSLQVEQVSSQQEGEQSLRRGRADALVLADRPPRVLVSEGRPEAKLAQVVVVDALERLEGRRPQATIEVARVHSPGTRYIDFLIPGLIGYSLLSNGLFSFGSLLVEMRMGRMLRRLKVSSVRRSNMLFGLVLGQMVQSLVESGGVLAAAYLLFGVRCVGSLPLFIGFTLLSALAFGGIAVAMGSRPRSVDGLQVLNHLLLTPAVLLSGVFFSAERFPAALQPVFRLIPTRAAIDGMRAVFNEGAGLTDLLRPGAIVAFWGALAFALGVRIFRWT